MLWGDSYTTNYTDKTDATVSKNVKTVADQQTDAHSLLNIYLTLTRYATLIRHWQREV